MRLRRAAKGIARKSKKPSVYRIGFNDGDETELEENGFAERTGRTRRSGYCEYPAMKFDRSKMAEFEEER